MTQEVIKNQLETIELQINRLENADPENMTPFLEQTLDNLKAERKRLKMVLNSAVHI